MFLNTALLAKVTRADKRLFVEVTDMCLETKTYVLSLAKSARKKLPLFECHTICRAIAGHIPNLKVVDGYYVGVSQTIGKNKATVYLRHCAHSWLVTPSGSIIDPYPVGFLSANAVLVVNRGRYKNFGGNLYWPIQKVAKKVSAKKLTRKVKLLSEIIGKAQKTRLA